jgi:hypothetical protein
MNQQAKKLNNSHVGKQNKNKACWNEIAKNAKERRHVMRTSTKIIVIIPTSFQK